MASETDPESLTGVLRRRIRRSGVPFLALARATGIQRMSLVRFARGERSLRLDKADRLAAYFGLVLRPAETKRKAN